MAYQELLSGKTSYENFGNSLASLQQGALDDVAQNTQSKEFYNSIKDQLQSTGLLETVAGVPTAIESVKSLYGTVSAVKTKLIKASEDIKGLGEDVLAKGKSILQAGQQTIESGLGDLRSAGEEALSQGKSVLQAGQQTVEGSLGELRSAVTSAGEGALSQGKSILQTGLQAGKASLETGLQAGKDVTGVRSVEFINPLFEPSLGGVSELDTLKDVLYPMRAGLEKGVSGVAEGASSTATKLAEGASSTATKLAESATGTATELAEGVSSTATKLAESATGTATKLAEGASGLLDVGKTAVAGLSDLAIPVVGEVALAGTAIYGVIKGFEDLFSKPKAPSPIQMPQIANIAQSMQSGI